ncbi:MAG: Mo-dependent nitrogenase C-terminal domain-containing protein [Prochloraceae cyanobacterium]|nr:Mo-dependent nitrogenase C-terminal domain-containing protein [Prochloraceae cyanobacterium]
MTAATEPTSLRSGCLFSLNLLLVHFSLLIEQIAVKNETHPRFICKLIPGNCSFEKRDFILFGKRLFHLSPICQPNLLSTNSSLWVGALLINYLSEDLNEAISQYIC